MRAKQAFERLPGLEYAAAAALENLNEARKALGLSQAFIQTEPQQLRRLTDQDRRKLVREARKKELAEREKQKQTAGRKREVALEVVRLERRKKDAAISEHNQRIEEEWNRRIAEGRAKAADGKP